MTLCHSYYPDCAGLRTEPVPEIEDGIMKTCQWCRARPAEMVYVHLVVERRDEICGPCAADAIDRRRAERIGTFSVREIDTEKAQQART
jgi:hypothetical protein